MEILNKIISTFKKADNDVYDPTLKNAILKTEKDKVERLAKWLPLPLKIYKFIHKDYEIPEDDWTVPLPDTLYKIVYPKVFKPKQNLTIARVILSYAKSQSALTRAVTELKQYHELGSYAKKQFAKAKQQMDTEGAPLYKALQDNFGELIDPTLIFTLMTGEKTNELASMLEVYIDDLTYDIRNNSRVKKALAYPLVVIVMIIAICVACKFYLYDALFSSLELTQPPSEFGPAFAIASIVTNPIKLIMTLLLLKFLAYLKRKSKSLRTIIEMIVLKLPGIGKFLVTKDLCYFFRHLYHYAEVDRTTVEAHVAALPIFNLETLRIIFSSKTDALIVGDSLSSAYADITYIRESLKLELSASEKNGTLNEALYSMQLELREEYQEATDTLIAQIPTYSIIGAGLALAVTLLPILNVVMNLDKYFM